MNVRKEPGWTSHDVVAKVRRLAGQKRVGHAGTLDPAAEGVLPVLLGRATRLADFVGEGRKRYSTEVQLGSATTTDDAEGDAVEQAPVPTLSRASIEAVLVGFTGEIDQVPPAYSAVKVAGKRAYAVARAGGSVELAARRVTIHEIELGEVGDDWFGLEIACSRGTYIRSLARDIARALGTVGHMRSLTRTSVGRFTLEQALTLDEIEERGVPEALMAPEVAMGYWPRLDASADSIARLGHGQSVDAEGLKADLVRVYDPEGRLAFVGIADGSTLRSRFPLAALD